MKQIFFNEEKVAYKIKKMRSDSSKKNRTSYDTLGKIMMLFSIPWLFFSIYELRKSGIYLWQAPLISFIIGLFFLVPGLYILIQERKYKKKKNSPLKVTKHLEN